MLIDYGGPNGRFWISANPPELTKLPQVGDLWFDTVNEILKRCTAANPPTFVSVIDDVPTGGIVLAQLQDIDSASVIGRNTAGSGSPEQLFTLPATIQDNISRLGSLVTNLFTTGTLTERSRSTPVGEWIDITFDSGDFVGLGGMTWTVEAGDIVAYKYMLVGKTMVMVVVVNTSSVTAPLGSYLQMQIPDGYLASMSVLGISHVTDNGVDGSGAYSTSSGTANIYLSRLGGAWSASVNNTSVRYTAIFGIQ